MVHLPRPTGCQIQLGSPDPLWEWHIPTDALFLSEGARRKLRLEKDTPPTMAAFAAHIPPDCLPSLHELLEGVLSGASGPMLELVYPFDDLLVRACLLIVERNNEGRAVRGVGQYSVSETLAYRPSVTTGTGTPDTGYWQCSLTERTIRMDSRCCALLGYADPRPMVISPEQWRQRLHPEEGAASSCRYQLTLELPQWGDSIEDVLRVRLENGEYARFALHGTVLERDADGHAKELAGSLQRIDAASAPARDSSQDAAACSWPSTPRATASGIGTPPPMKSITARAISPCWGTRRNSLPEILKPGKKRSIRTTSTKSCRRRRLWWSRRATAILLNAPTG